MGTEAVGDTIQQLTTALQTYLPNILGAIVVLILGWFIALIISSVVRGVLRRSGIDQRAETKTPLSQMVGKVTYNIVLMVAQLGKPLIYSLA